MCCSAWPAHFSKTITGTCEVLIENDVNHVIWYQNRIGTRQEYVAPPPAESTFQWLVEQRVAGRELDGFLITQMQNFRIDPEHLNAEVDWRKQGGAPRKLFQFFSPAPAAGNCLIVPIMGSWESIRLLNTFDTPHLLVDIDTALALPAPRSFAASMVETTWAVSGGGGRIAFVQFDIYDIVIAENASAIADVIQQIDIEKRPEINGAVFKRLEEWYQCPVAVCCFKSDALGDAKPIGFAFEPTYPDILNVYTLDGHDGRPPDPNAMVDLDHTIFVGSYLTPIEYTALVSYQDAIPHHLRPYVLDRVMGRPITDYLVNGDIVFDVAAVRAGYFEGRRMLPHFAPKQHAVAERIVRKDSYTNGRHSLFSHS